MKNYFLAALLFFPFLSFSDNDPTKNSGYNSMQVEDVFTEPQNTIQLEILVENSDSFVGFEFILEYPEEIMTFLPDPGLTFLTDRAADHFLFTSFPGPGLLKIFAFSNSLTPFSGNSGAVIKIGFSVNAPALENTFPLILAEAILPNDQGVDIIDEAINGTLHITVEENVYIISAIPNDASLGTVTGAGTYPEGELVTLTAIPEPGSNFVSWTENGAEVHASEEFSFVASANRELIANFVSDPADIPEIAFLDDINLLPGEEACFNATQSIITAGEDAYFIVQSGANATLIAGENIKMLPGTHIHEGANLHAYIAPDGPFCGEPEKHFPAVAEDNPAESKNTEITDVSEIETPADRSFTVFPNPATDYFTVELYRFVPDAKITVEVYSMQGRLILQRSLQPGREHVFSLEGQHPGIYMVKLIQDEFISVQRLIKR